MKRIISLVMSVLMIATMFCGFAVTSTAADNNGTITVLTTDNGDGTYDVKWYFLDGSTYGWHRIEIFVQWDENIVPVSREIAQGTGVVDVTGVNKFVTAVNSKFGASMTFDSKLIYDIKSEFDPILGFPVDTTVSDTVLISDTAAQNKVVLTTSKAGGQKKLASNIGDYVMPDEAATYFDSTYGFLVAEATVKLADGATSGVITATTPVANIANDYNTGAYTTVSDSIAVVSATIEGEAAPEEPTLPEGITLNVKDEVSIRNAAPAGMRFTAEVTATDFSDISEMGVAIVKGDADVATAETKLMIPARVDTDGNYLQAYTTDDAGDKIFTDGVTASAGTVTYTGVLSKMKNTNLSVDFTAYAYVIVDGVTYYSEAKCTENYNNIAATAANDPLLG